MNRRIIHSPDPCDSDCNPYGVSVLDTYRHHQGVKLSVDRSNRSCKTKHGRRSKSKNAGSGEQEEEDFFELEWIGLRPSQVEAMDLPAQVFQELTSNDEKRLDFLLAPSKSSSGSKSKPFAERGRNRAENLRDLRAMRKYKVELEALHWKGNDYLSRFVYETVLKHESRRASEKRRILRHFTGPPPSPPPLNQSDFVFGDGSDGEVIDDGISEITESDALI